MGDFVHLHLHSHYSLLDGLGKIEPLVARVKELGMDAVALTDHGVMYGIIDFVKTAHAGHIKPIVGVEAYLAPQGHTKKRGRADGNPRHVTLLAQNNEGYKNLIQLTTIAHLSGYYYKPRIDYDLLERHSAGVIVLSGCLNGDIAHAILEKRPADARRLIKWHLDLFGPDRFFLEVQHHPHLPEQQQLNEALFTYAKKYHVGLVATADAHYIYPDDAAAHDVLLCVQTGKTVGETDRMSMIAEDFSVTSVPDMKAAWREHPEAVDNTVRIAEMCTVDIEFGKSRLPRFPLPSGTTVEKALRQACEAGLTSRYGNQIPSGARERLTYELKVIDNTGYSSYFLIVADFVNEAKRRGILVGPGRGSAAGSLVSYLLNITNLDPLAYNLLFERFLNPERVSMPDIDLDFADDRRDEVIQYVREKYGHEHVAQIITFGTMAARASVRDAGRALGLPYVFCDQVAKAIPLNSDFKTALATSPDLQALYNGDPQAKKLIDTARRLEGVCRHASTHAAGVVITDEPLTEYVPLQHSSTGSDTSDTVTQYAMTEVESLGLLKIDFLGLKNLTIIQNALDRIHARYNETIDIDSLPLDDTLTYQLLQSGKTTGVFQLESSGMKRYLKELAPTEFEDIISMVALYRPGPMDSIVDFIAAKHGRREIKYLHPILKNILQKTYGVIVTQDQVLEIAREFAGFTYAEADILRKAVGKKIKSLLHEQREKFITGATTKKQIDAATARKVWDFIEPFARYGFNRAHAACYAMIAFQTAYLKSHYPAEFMAALLTSDEGNMDRAAIEVAEALSMGLEILPPDINESLERFTVVQTEAGKDAIRFGLAAIKNVGHNCVSAVIATRREAGPFADLADLFARVSAKDINRKSVESLARAGALDTLAERQLILDNIETLLTFNRSLHKNKDAGQQGLFGTTVAASPPRLTLTPTTPATRELRLKWEKELLGLYVSEHPLREFAKDLQSLTTPLADLREGNNQQVVRIAGVVTRIKKIMTKSNQPMLFVEIEDLGGRAEVLVFPRVLAASPNVWTDAAAVVIEGKLSDKDGETKVLVDKVWNLDREVLASLASTATLPPPPSKSPTPHQGVTLEIPAHFSKPALQNLKKILDQYHDPHGVPIELLLPRQKTKARLMTSYRLRLQPQTLAKLREVVGYRSITVK